MMRYLLGELGDEEQSEVEERFLTDNRYFEQLCSVEDALIDDYVQGALSEDERKKVKALLLSSPRQERELSFVRELIEDLSAKEHKDLGITGSTGAKPSNRIKSFLLLFGIQNPGWRLSLTVSLLAALIAIPLMAWNMSLQGQAGRAEADRRALEQKEQVLQQELERQRENSEALIKELEAERVRRSQVEQELAAIQETQPAIAQNTIATITLTTDAFSRGSADLPVIRITPAIARLRIRIELDENESYRSYTGVIETFEGRQIWNGEYVTTGGSLNKTVFSVPANVLANEHYTLTVRGKKENGEVVAIGDYSFRVKK
jgi:hypothetical protein